VTGIFYSSSDYLLKFLVLFLRSRLPGHATASTLCCSSGRGTSNSGNQLMICGSGEPFLQISIVTQISDIGQCIVLVGSHECWPCLSDDNNISIHVCFYDLAHDYSSWCPVNNGQRLRVYIKPTLWNLENAWSSKIACYQWLGIDMAHIMKPGKCLIQQNMCYNQLIVVWFVACC
jgi:hypothetical protein